MTDSAAVDGPLTPPRVSENSRLSSTDSESKSKERESDSDPPPPPPPPSGDPRDTRRSLVVKVVSGEGLPESSERLSRDAPPPAVVDSGTAMMEAVVGGRPPVGAWLMEWR